MSSVGDYTHGHNLCHLSEITLMDIICVICRRLHSENYYHTTPLRWRHNELDGVSDHQPHDCLLNRLFGCRSKKTSKLRVTGLCVGNSPGTGEFSAQMASNAENVSIWWRHHAGVNWPSDKIKSNTPRFRCILVITLIFSTKFVLIKAIYNNVTALMETRFCFIENK